MGIPMREVRECGVMKLIVHTCSPSPWSFDQPLNVGTGEVLVKRLTRRCPVLRFQSQNSNAAWKEGNHGIDKMGSL